MIRLVSLVSLRYVRTRRRSGGSPAALLSMLGVALGVTTLTVVLGVMNGFQLGFIESIVEISSYHLLAVPTAGKAAPQGGVGADSTGRAPGASAADALSAGQDLATRIGAVPGVRAVVPFAERQALVQGPYSRARPAVVRAVPPDLASRDPSQAAHLSMVEGSLDLASADAVVIGAELAAWLGTGPGDTLYLSWLGWTDDGRPQARRTALRVTGVYRCGYYDYDAGLVFVALSGPAAEGLPVTWGVKLADRFADRRALPAVSAALEGSGYAAESWRAYNRSFFDALLVEKLLMLALVGIIFVVVGFNTYHAQRRTVLERTEDIAVLKALGVPPRQLQYIFVSEGLVVGLAGAIAGTALGLLLAGNINAVFSGVEAVVNAALGLVSRIGGGDGTGFAIFSPTSFYLVEVPSRVLPREAFFVAFLAIFSCTFAAYAASRAVSRFRPAEVLRHE
ncbi:MAG: ABC transporter permease [Spirochaetes bacterium]|nr:ABC transporter permease [Spirochaetota bacterium]